MHCSVLWILTLEAIVEGVKSKFVLKGFEGVESVLSRCVINLLQFWYRTNSISCDLNCPLGRLNLSTTYLKIGLHRYLEIDLGILIIALETSSYYFLSLTLTKFNQN